MGRKYRLTWRTDQNGRWAKKYKKRSHYFKRQEGESKPESYVRCWQLWLKKKAEIDLGISDPLIRGVKKLISRYRGRLEYIQRSGDNSTWAYGEWRRCYRELENLEWAKETGHNFFPDNFDPEGPPFDELAQFLLNQARFPEPFDPDPLAGSITLEDYKKIEEEPPWEFHQPLTAPEKSLEANTNRFLQRKQDQAQRGERSVARYSS